MDEREYLRHDGLALGDLVARGEVTPAELLAAARTRAREVNPAINAICTWLDDMADERAAQPLSGPFAGVPFLLKDLHQHLAGAPTAAASRCATARSSSGGKPTPTASTGWSGQSRPSATGCCPSIG